MGVKGEPSLPPGYVETAAAPSLLMGGEKGVAGSDGKGLEALACGAGRAVLSSSTAEQRSYMRRDGRMSAFTYHLVEALTGHAQPREGASEVLVSDVVSYVHRHVPRTVRRDWDREQNPDFQLSGNFPVALLLGGKGLTAGQPPPDPTVEGLAERPARPVTRIDTGGGAYIGGSVHTTGGDFVGRDQIVHGDQVRGDKVMGDQVRGDQIRGLGGAEIARLFADVYWQIQARPEDPDVDRDEIVETVQQIEREVEKGEDANPHKIERWLGFLGSMADDILEVTVACLTHPLAGVAEVIRKVARRAKGEAGHG
jgi:hypothetical protein